MSSDHLPGPHTVRKVRVEDCPGAVVVVRPQVRVDPSVTAGEAWARIDWTRRTSTTTRLSGTLRTDERVLVGTSRFVRGPRCRDT
jgi:hypothetical protein